MNEKGNIIILVLLGFLVVLIVPMIITHFFWPAKIIMQIILIFAIYTAVRSFLGDSPLTLVFSAILIYLLAFKWFYITSSLYIFTFLMGLGFTSVIVWGIGTKLKPHGG
ncbi:MAG: hypothetical protein JW703_01980 [Candidatus Diapherotrites archaeon]|nr:hypothetical protein [Candidatus Diapherotrites archaeon]